MDITSIQIRQSYTYALSLHTCWSLRGRKSEIDAISFFFCGCRDTHIFFSCCGRENKCAQYKARMQASCFVCSNAFQQVSSSSHQLFVFAGLHRAIEKKKREEEQNKYSFKVIIENVRMKGKLSFALSAIVIVKGLISSHLRIIVAMFTEMTIRSSASDVMLSKTSFVCSILKYKQKRVIEN